MNILHVTWTEISVDHGEGNGNPFQYSCLENPVDGGAWRAAVHMVAQSRTRLKWLSMHALEKEMATHSSVLAWGIPQTEEPGGLQFTGLQRVRHDWSNLASVDKALNLTITLVSLLDYSMLVHPLELLFVLHIYQIEFFLFSNFENLLIKEFMCIVYLNKYC